MGVGRERFEGGPRAQDARLRREVGTGPHGLVMAGVGQGFHPGGFGNGRPRFSQLALGTGSSWRQSWGAVYPAAGCGNQEECLAAICQLTFSPACLTSRPLGPSWEHGALPGALGSRGLDSGLQTGGSADGCSGLSGSASSLLRTRDSRFYHQFYRREN